MKIYGNLKIAKRTKTSICINPGWTGRLGVEIFSFTIIDKDNDKNLPPPSCNIIMTREEFVSLAQSMIEMANTHSLSKFEF